MKKESGFNNPELNLIQGSFIKSDYNNVIF